MKEYEFTPSSKMLTVSEGLEVNIDLSAKRTAYRYENLFIKLSIIVELKINGHGNINCS